MGILYILGNGFDLHFHLQTSTDDFKAILKTKKIYDACYNALDVMSSYGVNWSDFEESLAEMDLEEIESSNPTGPDYLSDRESDRDGVIWNMQSHLSSINEAIFSSLTEMVRNANEQTLMLGWCGKKIANCNVGDAILSFNYTSTIENLYNLPHEIPLWHIHGYLASDIPLIFGYGTPKQNYTVEATEDDDFYIHQKRLSILDFYQNWRKKLKLAELEAFLRNCCGRIDKVHVYGHSLGIVDSRYMEMIEQILCPTEWLVLYHGPDDNVFAHATQYSFRPKIQFRPWGNFPIF